MAKELSETKGAEQVEEQTGKRQLRDQTAFGHKTIWDWLQLLIVPVILSLITVGFTWQQNRQQQEIEDKRTQSDQEIQEQRAQDGALQAYLDKMSELMLQKSLLNSEVGDTAFTLAQARTTTVIERFDAKHNQSVTRFLTDAGLTGADEGPSLLAGTVLRGAELANTSLQGANFVKQQQEGSDQSTMPIHVMSDPEDLVSTPSGVQVDVATILSGADLRGAGLQGANLAGCQLTDTILRNAALQDAELSNALLQGADLRGATLFGANLSGADLKNTDLKGARGVSHQTIALQNPSLLKGATMPNGKKYGDWFNDSWTYDTENFQPAFRFEVAGEWQFTAPDTTDTLSILMEGSEGGGVLFTNPQGIFDPNDLSKPPGGFTKSHKADIWVSWLQRHPYLDTSKPVPVSVGSASGQLIDVTYSSTPENFPQDICGEEPCVPLYTGSTKESTSQSYEGIKERFIILNVGEETVIIDISAPEGKFEKFVPKAQKLLDTVEWKSE